MAKGKRRAEICDPDHSGDLHFLSNGHQTHLFMSIDILTRLSQLDYATYLKRYSKMSEQNQTQKQITEGKSSMMKDRSLYQTRRLCTTDRFAYGVLKLRTGT